MIALKVKEMDFNYGAHNVFENANLVAYQGTVVGIMGANGAGKTTFFDILCGLRKPSKGHVTRACASPLYLSQTLSTSPSLRLGELFAMVVCLNGNISVSRDEAVQYLSRWSPPLAQRFEGLWNKRPGQCSYGQIRYFFALTLLCLPSPLILLDEPTAGVDPEHRHYIWQCIHAARQEGATILVASHHIEEITRHAQTFWMIRHKQFECFDSQQAFLQRFPAADVDAAFIRAATG